MKKLLSLVLILALVLTTVIVADYVRNENVAYGLGAADFTDVKKDYWGYSFIDFAAGKGIINGYPDPKGTYYFAPEAKVSKEEAMSMLYHALSAAGELESKDDFSPEYESLFLEHQIATWAQKYVAYALKYKLVSKEELTGFTDDKGYGLPATREEVAVWTGKALDKGVAPAYSLDYVDKDNISAAAMPYVDLLYRQGIMQGDNTKMFHAESSIKRVEFAVICNKVFDLYASDNYKIDKEVQSYRGTILSVDIINHKVTMSQSGGAAKVIQINPKTNILIDGKVGYNGMKDIPSNVVAVIAFGTFHNEKEGGRGTEALQLHIVTKTQARVGLLSDTEKINQDISILTIKNAAEEEIYYVLDQHSTVLSTLQKGKEVTFITDGVKILEIQ